MKCKCGEIFTPYTRNGIAFSKLCTKCLIEKGKVKLAANAKKERKEAIKKNKERKVEIKTHTELCNELQKEINRIARLIDYGQSCIVHSHLKNENGGHFKSVKAHPNLRFNLHNIFGQSVYSNKYKGGQEVLYLEGLKRVFGLEYAEYVETLNARYPSINLSRADILELIPKSRAIVRRLKADLTVNDTLTRMQLRYSINKELGIYE